MSRFTELLAAVAVANEQATSDLFDLVYDELRKLAANQMAQENAGHSLQPTALVHEAYLRLIGDPTDNSAKPRWQNSRHFIGAAAKAMRRILIESARRKKLQKHGGGLHRAVLDPDKIAAPELADDLLALDEALTEFAALEPEIAKLVTLRYFGGLTLKEAADALGIGHRTADTHWAYARVWLLDRIRKDEHSPP